MLRQHSEVWSLCLLWILHLSMVFARDITMFTQTNLSSQYLTNPDLNLPFTSIVYIGPGANASAAPPATIRICQMQDSKPSGGWTPPTLLYMQHTPNFTLPTTINTPNGLAWHSIYIGATNDTAVSPHFLMRTWGLGIIADLWEIVAEEVDKDYRLGVADENLFMKGLLNAWGLEHTAGAQQYSAQVAKWVELTDGLSDVQSSKVTLTRIDMVNSNQAKIWDYDLSKPKSQGFSDYRYSGDLVSGIFDHDLFQSANHFLRTSLQPTDNIASWRGAQPIQDFKPGVACSGACSTISGDGSFTTQMALARQRGVMSTFSLVSKEAASALSKVVLAAAATFVILDFIDGNYVGGAMGAIGVGVASLLPLIMENPIGIILGTVLAFLFFILPGVFETPPKPAPIHNNTQIIQYTFFGDKDHTGNERCQQDHPGCVASYGPGILALSLKWEYFDAIVFMIWANQGFPITIPDMGEKLGPAISLDKDRNSSAVAGITCGNYVGAYIGPDRWGTNTWHGTPLDLCNNPAFYLNRENLILPNLNRTAADVYKDIVGADGKGSCKIIDNADNPITLPDYGIQIRGLPVAIACGINATLSGERTLAATQTASNVSTEYSSSNSSQVQTSPNTTVETYSMRQNVTVFHPSEPAPSILPIGSSPGSQSTDGRAGEGYIPPPPATPFANSLIPSNSACFTSSNMPNHFCLPNGTYSRQDGTFNFDTTKVTGLALPPGGSVVVRYTGYNGIVGDPTSTKKYTKNQTASKSSEFAQNMNRIFSRTFDVIIPSPLPPPVACMFTETQFAGDVTCVGVGGGNMTEGAGKVASVGIFGGARVTLYPNRYGDAGSQTFTVSLPDLASVPHGTNGTLKGLVKAVLVQSS